MTFWTTYFLYPYWWTTTSSRHWSQTSTAFRLISISGRSTHSALHRRRQSVSCRGRPSVEQSPQSHVTSAPSLSIFRSRLKFHLFSVSCPNIWLVTFFTCSAPAQWLCHFGHYNHYYIRHYRPAVHILMGQAKTLHTPLSQSHQVFFRYTSLDPVCIIFTFNTYNSLVPLKLFWQFFQQITILKTDDLLWIFSNWEWDFNEAMT